jgi:hypothetical protein
MNGIPMRVEVMFQWEVDGRADGYLENGGASRLAGVVVGGRCLTLPVAGVAVHMWELQYWVCTLLVWEASLHPFRALQSSSASAYGAVP